MKHTLYRIPARYPVTLVEANLLIVKDKKRTVLQIGKIIFPDTMAET